MFWKHFLQGIYRKSYTSFDDDTGAFEEFSSNLKLINTHNDESLNRQHLYKLDVWEYSDLSPADINQFMNNFMAINFKEKIKGKILGNVNFTIDFSNVFAPPSLNYTSLGAVTSVRNQVINI